MANKLKIISALLICLAAYTPEAATLLFPEDKGWIGEWEVLLKENGKEETLTVTLFYNKGSYLSLIRTPAQRKGMALLYKGGESLLYFPKENSFLTLEPGELLLLSPFPLYLITGYGEPESSAAPQENTIRPLSTPGGLIKSVGFTLLEGLPALWEYFGQEEQLLYSLQFTSWGRYGEQLLIPEDWKVTDHRFRGRGIYWKLKEFNLTDVPEYIFTGTYIMLLSGNQ